MTTSHLLMIRPVNFTFNEQTAVNNAFQVAGETSGVQHQARDEVDELVNKLQRKFCDVMDYRPVTFHGVDQSGRAIYHTNVMMCVGDDFVVICLESISHVSERSLVEETINASGKKLVEISFGQMNNFAGNMLQVSNREGKKFLVMSSRAYASLSKEQLQVLEARNEIIHSSLNTIETNGGGSARCMIAEVFY